MLLNLRIVPKTYGTLRTLVKPQSASQPESLPWVLFDTQQYPSAGTARLTYYNSTQANLGDNTLSNLPNGTLETYQYFELHRAFYSFLAPLSITTTAAVTGSANDVDLLLKSARMTTTLSYKNKSVGPFPADFFGMPGGNSSFIAAEGSETAPGRNILQLASTVMNGGFPYLGSVIFEPATKFTVFADFNATVVAINASMNVRHAIMGVLHRRVA